MNKKEGKKSEEIFGTDLGFGNLFKGLGDLLGKLSELAEKGTELSRTGEIKIPGKEEGFKGVYGFTVKVGGLGDKLKVEPFGNVHKGKEGETFVDEIREPLVDVFEEEDHTLIVAEMPGIEEKDIKIELSDDILDISGENKGKMYYKEIFLKQSFTKDKMSHSYKNGILEIRLKK